MTRSVAACRTLVAVVAGVLALLAPGAAEAQTCPSNSTEVGQRQDGDKLVIRCACNPGFITAPRSCLAIDEAAKQFYLTEEEVLRAVATVIDVAELLELAADEKVSLWDRVVAWAASIEGLNGQAGTLLKTIEMAGPDVTQNLAIVSARKKAAAEATRQVAQTWMLLRPEVRGPFIDLATDYMPMKARATYLIGVVSFRHGQYDEALTYFKSAQKVLPGDKGIEESLLITRLTQRSQWEARHPKAARLQEARAFRAGGAQAAWQMGMQLLAKGDYAGSELFLREAGVRMRQVNARGADIGRIDRLADTARGEREAGSKPRPSVFGAMDGWSKVDFMLTACEYGQKDWGRTLRFLEIALMADPANAAARQAYAELKDIAASAQ